MDEHKGVNIYPKIYGCKMIVTLRQVKKNKKLAPPPLTEGEREVRGRWISNRDVEDNKLSYVFRKSSSDFLSELWRMEADDNLSEQLHPTAKHLKPLNLLILSPSAAATAFVRKFKATISLQHWGKSDSVYSE